MEIFLTVLHIVVAIFLVLAVLLQSGKGTEIGAAFGGSSNTLFGASGGGNLLTKFTTAVAIIFMVTSIGLTIMKSKSYKKSVVASGSSVVDTAAKKDVNKDKAEKKDPADASDKK